MENEILINKFTIVKKGRKYFKTKLNDIYNARLKIDNITENFEVGLTYELQVKDLSVVTSFGSSMLFEAVQEEKPETPIPYFIKLEKYNTMFIQLAKKMSGRFNRENKIWEFHPIAYNRAEELDEIFNSNLIPIEITAKENAYQFGYKLEFIGYEIARYVNNSILEFPYGVLIEEGEIIKERVTDIETEKKHWITKAVENTVIKLEVNENVLERCNDLITNWIVKKL